MSRTVKLLIAGIVVVAVGIAVFVACSGGPDEPGPDPTGTGSATPTEPGEPGEPDVALADLSAALFATQEDVLASADGAIPVPGEPIPATVELTDVYAGRTSTVVRFTLIATNDDGGPIHLSAFNQARMMTDDIRDVAIVDEDAELRLRPFVGGRDRPWDGYCTCSISPRGVTTAGLPLTATFPPVDGGDTVTVEIPGFPPLESITVRRD